jgi:DNA-binding MarR family transcriptional regulator
VRSNPGQSNAVDGHSLERKDFMHRTRGEDDRRSQHLFLTERGRRLKAELLPIGVAINRSALVGVDPAHAGLAATFSNG